MRRSGNAVMLLVLLLLSMVCGASDYEIREMLDPLTSVGGWTVGGDNYGKATKIEVASDPDGTGQLTAALIYEFTGVTTGYNNCQYIKRMPISASCNGIVVDVYGDGSGHALRMRIVDSTGKYLQYTFALLTWVGWREVSVNLRGPDVTWGGDEGRLPVAPFSFHGFLIDSKSRPFKGQGTIYVRNLRQAYLKTPTFLYEGFEDDSDWQLSTTSGSGQAYQTTEFAQSGRGSLKVQYQDMAAGGFLTITPKHSILLSDYPLEFSVYAYGTFNSGCFLLSDGAGREFQLPFGPSVFGQWFKLKGNWHDANVPELPLTPPIFFQGLRIYPQTKDGEFYLDLLVCDAMKIEEIRGGVFLTNQRAQVNYTLTSTETHTIDAFLQVLQNDSLYFQNKKALKVEGTVRGQWELPFLTEGFYQARFFYSKGKLQIAGPATEIMITTSQQPVSRKKPYIGVQTHYAHGKGKLPDNIQMAASAGVDMIRDEVYWRIVEKTKGEFVFPQLFDDYINEAIGRGMLVLLELNFGNEHYGGGAPETPGQLEAWGRYVEAVVRRYHDRVKHWEIWNEFDGGMGLREDQRQWSQEEKAQYYVPLLKTAYNIIKDIDPGATVIGCVTAGIRLEFIDTVFALGGGDYMDAVSVHPYCHPASPEAGDLLGRLDELRALLASHNCNHPIWITEIGWPTHIGRRGVSEQLQAIYLARMYTILLDSGKADAILWYDFHDDGTDEYYSQHNFGIIRYDYSLKPAYAALTTVCQEILGFTHSERLEMDDDIWAYRFIKDGDEVYVFWTTGSDTTITFPSLEPVIVRDVFGHKEEYAPGETGLKLNISHSPIFVRKKSVMAPNGGVLALSEKAVRQGQGLRLTLRAEKQIDFVTVRVFNLAGSKVKEKTFSALGSTAEFLLSTDGLLPGMYILQAVLKDVNGSRTQEQAVFLVL